MKPFILVFSIFFLTSIYDHRQKAIAEERDAQVSYLARQFDGAVRGSHQPAAFVRSYEGSLRAYTYDQALAAIVFTHAGERQSARKILNALWNAQLPAGGFRFSYPVDDANQISGSIAWVVIAANTYQAKFGSGEYEPMAHAALEHLAANLVGVEMEGIRSRAVRFAPGDDRRTSWNETQVVSLEHNLDAYSAFDHYRGTDRERFNAIATEIHRFLVSMWAGDHFHAGFNLETRRPNTDEIYLDTQSWGVLALGKSYVAGLEMNCEEFSAKVRTGKTDLSGFFDMRATKGLPREKFIWSEGTLGMLLALDEAGQDGCGNLKSADIRKSIVAMTGSAGGVAYATPNAQAFSTRPSVSGTAWAYFSQQGFNPFQ